KALQQIAGIGLIDTPRANDVQFTHGGKPISLDAALELARQGRAVQVQKAASVATLTNVDHLGTPAMTVEAKAPTAAQKLRDQANQITVRDAFQKARSELLVAKLSGLSIFLIDTQHKDKGFARFLDAFSDKQLTALADTAHEMGMDIWAAGSIGADGYGRIVKAGWNLVCFGGAARDASGLRPESDFVSIRSKSSACSRCASRPRNRPKRSARVKKCSSSRPTTAKPQRAPTAIKPGK